MNEKGVNPANPLAMAIVVIIGVTSVALYA